MDAVTYLKEKERLTKCSSHSDCSSCRLGYDNNKFKITCDTLESKFPEEAIRIIEEWSKEIDWSKVEVDTRLLTSDDDMIWDKRHFAKYEDGKVYVYQQGCSSYTTQQIETYVYNKFWIGERK